MLILNWFSFLKPCCPDGWLTANSNHRPAVVDNVAEEGAKILRNALFSNGLVKCCHKWFEIWIERSKEHDSVNIFFGTLLLTEYKQHIFWILHFYTKTVYVWYLMFDRIKLFMTTLPCIWGCRCRNWGSRTQTEPGERSLPLRLAREARAAPPEWRHRRRKQLREHWE